MQSCGQSCGFGARCTRVSRRFYLGVTARPEQQNFEVASIVREQDAEHLAARGVQRCETTLSSGGGCNRKMPEWFHQEVVPACS